MRSASRSSIDLPAVGANYHDHLAAGILMEMSNSESYGISLRAAPRGALNLLEYALFRRGPLASNVFEANAFVRSRPKISTGPICRSCFSRRGATRAPFRFRSVTASR